MSKQEQQPYRMTTAMVPRKYGMADWYYACAILTPEQRSEIARKGAAKKWANARKKAEEPR